VHILLPVAEAGADRDRAEALAQRVTVGVVTALPEERAAMLAMLDRPVSWTAAGRGAGRVYDLGEIPSHDGGRHVVALALADMGNNIAAARGALVLQHFPDVEAILMVGIAGGVPNPERAEEHVRLGDLVVSDRRGVIQYDFIKKKGKIAEVRASPRPPHARLLEAARLLESDAHAGARPWEALVQRAADLPGAARPDPSTDVLLASKAPFQRVKHPADRKRIEGQPRVFFGSIASANVLLKDPLWRDRLREQYGAKAVEMEASGIADATWQAGAGYIAVRGICDYCDRSKNDDWHMYAAVVAAAYARALLERMAGGVAVPAEGPRHNLRARNPYFQGRGEELAWVEQALRQERQATITHASVFGLGGVGKSALALEAAHRAVDRGEYPGGVWWVAAEGDPVDALVRLAPALRALAPEEVRRRLPSGETHAEAIAEQVRLALGGQRAPSLVVLDNVSAPGWGKYVPGGAVRVLVTTRDAGLSLGKTRQLGVLSNDEARALAEAIAGETPDKAEVEARDRVAVTELGRLAVAVEMAARTVKRWFRGSWAEYERVLREEMERVLEDPKLVGEYGRGVFAAIDLSIDKCDAEGRELLEGAAVFAPEEVPVEWALAAAGLREDGFLATRAREGLRELGLVTVDDGEKVISMHRLVHRRVRGRAEKEHKEAWDEAGRRGVTAVAAWVEGAVELHQTREEMETLDVRREHVEQALDAATRTRNEDRWIRIAHGLGKHLRNRARYSESLDLFRRALTIAEQISPPDPSVVGASLSNLAMVLQDLGQPAAARPLIERALAFVEAMHGPNHGNVAKYLSNLAVVDRNLGQHVSARLLLERALIIDEATYGPNHRNVATDLSNLANVHRGLGQPAVARPLIERALAIDETAYGPEHPSVAIRLTNLALVHMDLAQPAAARPLLERALAIDEATYGPDHPNVARNLSHLALVHVSMGEHAAARPLFERALRLAEDKYGPNHPIVAIRLSNLAGVNMDLGEPAVARPLLEDALRIDEATYGAHHPAVAKDLSNLAALYAQLDQPAEARVFVERALAAAEKAYAPDHPALARLRSNLAVVLHRLAQAYGRDGGWETARSLAEQVRDLAERADEPLLVAESYRLLADAALHGSDYENAKIFYEEAIRRADELDRPKAAAAARLVLVPLLIQFGHLARSARHVAWLRAHLASAELAPRDRADIEDVLRVADAARAADGQARKNAT
jgi:nucleoside phosphorylase/Tfp pilus assembly protein PilF